MISKYASTLTKISDTAPTIPESGRVSNFAIIAGDIHRAMQVEPALFAHML